MATTLAEKESLLEAAGFEKELMGPFFAAYTLHLTDEIEITAEIEEEPVAFCLYNGDEVIRSIEPYEDESFEETLKRALRSGNNLKKKSQKGMQKLLNRRKDFSLQIGKSETYALLNGEVIAHGGNHDNLNSWENWTLVEDHPEADSSTEILEIIAKIYDLVNGI